MQPETMNHPVVTPAPTFNHSVLHFEGYWRASNLAMAPVDPGIYCVYLCRINSESGLLTLTRLLHVGSSEDVRQSLERHPRAHEWSATASYDEEVCFSVCPVPDAFNRDRYALHLAQRHRVSCDVVSKSWLQRNPVRLEVSGAAAYLCGDNWLRHQAMRDATCAS